TRRILEIIAELKAEGQLCRSALSRTTTGRRCSRSAPRRSSLSSHFPRRSPRLPCRIRSFAFSRSRRQGERPSRTFSTRVVQAPSTSTRLEYNQDPRYLRDL